MIMIWLYLQLIPVKITMESGFSQTGADYCAKLKMNTANP